MATEAFGAVEIGVVVAITIATFVLGVVCGRRLQGKERDLYDLKTELIEPMKRMEEDIQNLGERSVATDTHIDTLISNTGKISGMLTSIQKRGRYAEVQVERILQISGLDKTMDYEIQKSLDTSKKPDFVVHITKDRGIIIDSKAPLESLQRAFEANDEKTKAKEMQGHVNAVKTHIRELSSKYSEDTDYPYVVMVVPEYALLPALQHDDGLNEYALEKKVVLATPHALMLLLQTMIMLGKQDRVADAVREVSDLSRTLHSKLVKFITQYARASEGLDKAIDEYNKGARLWRREVLPATDKLATAGATISNIQSIEESEKRACPPPADDSK